MYAAPAVKGLKNIFVQNIISVAAYETYNYFDILFHYYHHEV